MKPKKAKASTAKQPAKKSMKKQPKLSKAPVKGNTCKQQASDVSNDANSNNDIAQACPKWKQQKKNKHTEEVNEEETKATEPEEIVKSDVNDEKAASEEEPECNGVSQMIVRDNNNSPNKIMMNPQNNTN